MYDHKISEEDYLGLRAAICRKFLWLSLIRLLFTYKGYSQWEDAIAICTCAGGVHLANVVIGLPAEQGAIASTRSDDAIGLTSHRGLTALGSFCSALAIALAVLVVFMRQHARGIKFQGFPSE